MPKRSRPGQRPMQGTGAGKGDAPRYKHDENWTRNFSEIEFPKDGDDGFHRVNPGKITKRYGVAETKPQDRAPHVKVSR